MTGSETPDHPLDHPPRRPPDHRPCRPAGPCPGTRPEGRTAALLRAPAALLRVRPALLRVRPALLRVRPALLRAPAALPVAVAVAGVLGAVHLALVDPSRPGHYPVCLVLRVTGWYCPGCGGLRAGHELLHGRPMAALGQNALVVLLAPVALLAFARWARDRTVGRPPRGEIPVRWLVLVGVLTVGFGVLRNLSACSFLAP
ncbi:MAG: hypothetical protein QG608_2478 [Actinomycetota bacterium]|nr:hypothetical protein [Actinomycetota bacterium]